MDRSDAAGAIPERGADALVCERSDEPRLDLFLSEHFPEWSRTRLQRLIQAGAVTVNGTRSERAGARLAPGSRVEVAFAPRPPAAPPLQAEDIPLEVLYADADLAVINKPAGLLVHAGAGQHAGTLVNALMFRFQQLSSAGGAGRPGIVHRLDRFTSGAMVVALNDFAHQRLAEQFQRREVKKTYQALVQGLMPAPAGDVNLPIGRDRQHRIRMTTRRRNGREALTSYRTLEAFPPPASASAHARASGGFSWLEVNIHSGRTHQIRVHLAALGHPVVGDRLYGAAAALAGPGELRGFRPPRVMLHSGRLVLSHPRSGSPIDVTAPLPSDFADLAARLRAAGQPL